jgi:hypothetical protein
MLLLISKGAVRSGRCGLRGGIGIRIGVSNSATVAGGLLLSGNGIGVLGGIGGGAGVAEGKVSELRRAMSENRGVRGGEWLCVRSF